MNNGLGRYTTKRSFKKELQTASQRLLVSSLHPRVPSLKVLTVFVLTVHQNNVTSWTICLSCAEC